MTAEVAILNQHAVVLAADSAVTVSALVNGRQEERYFKGANKLFQLSERHPVGIMIYDSASLHSVPWEIVIKDFRRHLGGASRDTVAGYAESFFAFIKLHTGLFPPDTRHNLFISQAANFGIQALFDAADDDTESSLWESEALEPATVDALRQKLSGQLAELEAREGHAPFSVEHVKTSVDRNSAAVSEHIEHIAKDDLSPTAAGKVLIDLLPILTGIGIHTSLKDYRRLAAKTGIVVAGYGDLQYFPALEVFNCFGFVDSELVYDRAEASSAIGENTPSIIEPFATQGMVNTLRMGMSPDVFRTLHERVEACLTAFGEKLATKLGVTATPESLTELVTDATKEYVESVVFEAFDNHSTPLVRVISALPVGDMAALAKSLIELQSLKERVTKPTETVAGPIDVAVISKHDGFIWIDRKHYFRPELNPRFISRLQSISP